MKVIAYLDPYGHETVTPLKAKKRNIRTVYSTHKPGERLEMYVNRRGSNHYFAYKSDADHSRLSEPETLTHTLCKEVIAELANEETKTVLKFFNRYGPYSGRPPVAIVLTKGILEHRLQVSERQYSIDAYCEFNPNDDMDNDTEGPAALLSLFRQWDGKIAFEIYHTHKVGSTKYRDLESAGIPVFQIGIDSKSILYIDENIVTQMDDIEADGYLRAHREKLRRIFRKGIGGVVLNNPKSPGFLAAEDLYRRLYSQAQEIQELNDEITFKNQEMDGLAEETSRQKMEQRKFADERNTLLQKMHDLIREKENLQTTNTRLNEEIDRLQNSKPKSWFSKLFK